MLFFLKCYLGVGVLGGSLESESHVESGVGVSNTDSTRVRPGFDLGWDTPRVLLGTPRSTTPRGYSPNSQPWGRILGLWGVMGLWGYGIMGGCGNNKNENALNRPSGGSPGGSGGSPKPWIDPGAIPLNPFESL